MSRSAEVDLDWADGTYRFALGIKQLAELQECCDAGPWYVQWALESAALARVAGLPPPKDLVPAYVIEPIRLGLIGGGMEAVAALKLVRAYVGPGQLAENMAPAYAIVSVALQGAPEDQPAGKPAAGRTSGRRSRAAKSASPTSTDQDLPPA